jgi:pimeloyl-ACP methyl ester carboxylesterase
VVFKIIGIGPSMAGVLLLASGCGADHSSATAKAARRQTMATRPLQARVNVGGYKLYLDCTGRGSPTVILEAGYGDDHTVWRHVQASVAAFSRVCSYDRADLGESGHRPGNTMVGAQELAQTLHTLLVNARVPGPYVLVGHSLGGPIVRLYAYQRRSQVAGMVLVDAEVEGFCAAVYGACQPYIQREPFNASRSLTELRQATHDHLAGSLGSMPLVVLSAGRRSLSWSAYVYQSWMSLQTKLPTLSSNSMRVIATRSTHAVPTGQPKLVVEAIRVVVTAVRSKGHALPACGHQFERLGGKCVSSGR